MMRRELGIAEDLGVAKNKGTIKMQYASTLRLNEDG
jgi:hypothetical protein